MRAVTNLAFIGILVLAGCLIGKPGLQDPPPLDHALQLKLAAWLNAEDKTPGHYVAGLFSGHDVVFLRLTESHRWKGK